MRAACKVFRMLVQYGKSDGIDRGTSDGISRGKTITPARENILGNREIHEIHGTSMSIFDINSMLDLFDGSISSSYEKMAFRDASSFQFQFRDHGDRFFTTREREREINMSLSLSRSKWPRFDAKSRSLILKLRFRGRFRESNFFFIRETSERSGQFNQLKWFESREFFSFLRCYGTLPDAPRLFPSSSSPRFG